jgi:hypothetical protein
MNSKKLLSCGALGIGILIFIIGAVFVVMYLSEAIIARLGEPDQSLLFWYLPILFIGIIGIIIGLAASILGIIGLRRSRNSEAHNEEPTLQ